MEGIFESPEINYNFIKNLNNIYEIKFNKYKKEIIKLIIQQIKQDDKILKN
jgi:hypothetical protein|tara:strand:- start:1911 stop:2063 length:153 start_codon:yes stop_codon:yes gene_type:complete